MSERREYPRLLSEEENAGMLRDAETLWRELQRNDLGGFSGGNRPFWILYAYKTVIEKYGKRDVGLTWSKDELEAALSEANGPEPSCADSSKSPAGHRAS